MLTINRAGSVTKTSDTWWKYRYLPPNSQVSTVSILGIGIVPIPSIKSVDNLQQTCYRLLRAPGCVSLFRLLRDVNEWINNECSECMIRHLNISN